MVDSLAKSGAEGLDMNWIGDSCMLPTCLRGIIRMDIINIPYMRIS